MPMKNPWQGLVLVLLGISWFDFTHHDPEFVEGSDCRSQISDCTRNFLSKPPEQIRHRQEEQ